jgi:hypothetical protein
MGRAKEVAEIDGFRNTLDADGEIAARPRKLRFHDFLYPGRLAAAKLPATAKSGNCLYNFGVPSPTLAKSFSRHRVTRGVTGTNDSKSKLFRAKTFDFIEDSDRLDTPEAVLDTMIRVVSRFGFVSGILPKPGETLDDLILAHHSPDGSAAFSCQCMARAVMKLPWRWPALMWISRAKPGLHLMSLYAFERVRQLLGGGLKASRRLRRARSSPGRCEENRPGRSGRSFSSASERSMSTLRTQCASSAPSIALTLSPSRSATDCSMFETAAPRHR